LALPYLLLALVLTFIEGVVPMGMIGVALGSIVTVVSSFLIDLAANAVAPG